VDDRERWTVNSEQVGEPRPTWRQVVASAVDSVLKATPTEEDRDVTRPGIARVVFAGMSRICAEADIESVASQLRNEAVAELGEHEVVKLSPATVERRGLRFGERGLIRSHLGKALRQALHDLYVQLLEAGSSDDDHLGQPGAHFLPAEARKYRSSVNTLSDLLNAPRITDQMIAVAVCELGKTIGRAVKKTGSRVEKKVAVLALVQKHPNSTNQEIADTVGVHVANLNREDRWKAAIECARAQGMRDRSPAAADKLLGNQGRWVQRKYEGGQMFDDEENHGLNERV
jgi:hypothetical protein